MSVKNLVSEFVKEAPPYVVGADEQSKSMRPGVTKLLQLATNENPFGTSPKAAEAICQQAPLANRYPDVRAQDLRKKLAEKHGLSVDEVMVTEGRLPRAWLHRRGVHPARRRDHPDAPHLSQLL